MRLIVGITLVLLGIGTWSCRLEGLSADLATQSAPEWVRTADGWERPDTWLATTAPPPPLHPLLVAVGQTLLSILALAACCLRSAQRADVADRPLPPRHR